MRPAINLERFNRKILTFKNRLPPAVRKVFSGITLSLHEQPRMKYLLLFIGIWIGQNSMAQTPDSIYMPNISSAKLYLKGNQMAYPLLTLNSGDRLELVFDDL